MDWCIVALLVVGIVMFASGFLFGYTVGEMGVYHDPD